jgi:hypothetical protein
METSLGGIHKSRGEVSLRSTFTLRIAVFFACILAVM